MPGDGEKKYHSKIYEKVIEKIQELKAAQEAVNEVNPNDPRANQRDALDQFWKQLKKEDKTK